MMSDQRQTFETIFRMSNHQHNQVEQQSDPGPVNQPTTGQIGLPRRTIEDWRRDMMANLNRMAADEQYRREITARES